MKSSEIRKELHKYVDEADSKALKFLKEALVTYNAKKIGKEEDLEKLNSSTGPYSDDELITRILESENNLKKGNFTTHQEVKDRWKNFH